MLYIITPLWKGNHMNKAALIGLSTGILSATFASAGVSGDQWLMSDFSGGFYSYEQGSGAALSLGTIPSDVIGIEFGGDGNLYAMTTFVGGGQFYQIDPTNGSATLIGASGLTQPIEGDLAWDVRSGQMYGNYGDSTSNSLYTIDLMTGVATVIGDIEEDDISGLAFDQAGRLWGVDTNTNFSNVADLVEIDKNTGSVLSRVSLGIQTIGPLLGMDINDQTGELFMAMDDGNFYSIDTVAGSATFVDTHGVLTATGLAYGVPAPSSVLALMGAGLLGARRRR